MSALLSRCVVCGDEFMVDAKDDAQFESYLASVTVPNGQPPHTALAWVEDPVVLATSCGPLVHPGDEVVVAVRLHGGVESFYQFTRSWVPVSSS